MHWWLASIAPGATIRRWTRWRCGSSPKTGLGTHLFPCPRMGATTGGRSPASLVDGQYARTVAGSAAFGSTLSRRSHPVGHQTSGQSRQLNPKSPECSTQKTQAYMKSNNVKLRICCYHPSARWRTLVFREHRHIRNCSDMRGRYCNRSSPCRETVTQCRDTLEG